MYSVNKSEGVLTGCNNGIMVVYMANYKGNQGKPDNTGKTYKTHKPNIQAQMFATFFLDPTSKTFWNARGSAIRAGYSEQYADSITVQKPKWYVELTESAEYRRAEMLKMAEVNMHRRLGSVPETDVDKRLQADTDKFVTERLGKQYYSTRQEVTGADGRALFDEEKRAASAVELASLFKGVDNAT